MRRFFGLCLAALVTGCSGVYLEQDGHTAIVRTGSYANDRLPSNTITGYFVPYALLALRAYDDDLNRPGPRWLDIAARGEDVGRRARDWMSEWVALFHHTGRLPCKRDGLGCGVRVGGLDYKVWRRKDCSEIVIAFRGTDFDQATDWASNLRWFTRLLPLHDQYEQVQDWMPQILDTIQAEYCVGRNPKITAVGHSLGAGLAQTAAYTDARIRHVYGFDPTFVTGYYDGHIDSARNSRGLMIDHVYEHGEILAYGRFFLRRIAPPSACNPTIRDTRVNVIYGQDIVTQHNIVDFTEGLIRQAGDRRTWRARRAPPLPEPPELGDAALCPRGAAPGRS